jgi:hypothetical protein
MKLLTMFHNDERAAADLARRTDLRAIFRTIEGCAEWSVRVSRVPGSRATSRKSVPAARKIGSRSGTDFLLQKKGERDRSRAESAAVRRAVAAALRSLSAAARDHVRKEAAVPGTNLLLDAAFLVPRARERRFLAAAKQAARLAHRVGCELSLSGPWPAYHFVSNA